MPAEPSLHDPYAPRPILKPGGTVGVVAPSSFVAIEAIAPALAVLEHRGHRVVYTGNVGSRMRFAAGNDEERAEAVMHAFRTPDIDAVISARGGYGSTRILSRLDFDVIAANRKLFVGFSDATALQLALLAKAGLPSVSGMSLFPELRDGQLVPRLEGSLWPLLYGGGLFVSTHNVIRTGVAEGPVVAACLSMLISLIGTPFLPDLRGSILVLEDVNEEPYRLDRLLLQLRDSGNLDGLAALAFGAFARCDAKDGEDGTVEDVLQEAATWVQCPVVTALPYGHVPDRCALPVGIPGRLSANEQTGTLEIFASA